VDMARENERKSADVGRKPSKNPLVTLLSFRIDAETTKALDAELERQLAEQPGLLIGRGDLVRMALIEWLRSKAEQRKKGKK
jgi:hypothetical protein